MFIWALVACAPAVDPSAMLDTAEAVCEPPAPPPMRRLSHVEYRNTVRDLFGGIELPEVGLASDVQLFGFENNAELMVPSELLVEQYQGAAEVIAGAAMQDRNAWMPCTEAEADCPQRFVRDFGLRAYRRPLQQSELDSLGVHFDAERALDGFDAAVERTLWVMLQSPQFLYRLELDPPDGHEWVPLDGWEMASRLSYLLWQTMPDDRLFDAARHARLSTEVEIRAEAQAMLQDARARSTVADFHRQWLDVDDVHDVRRDPTVYPDFDASFTASMAQETLLFAEHHVFDGAGTLDALLTGHQTYVDPTLADLYGVSPPPPGTWALTPLDPSQRAGLLTTSAFLASRGHAIHPSPVLRGVTVLERVLCTPVPPPPPGIDLSPPDDQSAGATNRERYALHSQVDECASCHASIDGVGFGFEHYDATGAWRDTDGGYPVDATGELVGTDIDGGFDGAVALADRLASSRDVERCFATQWFRFAHGRDEDFADRCTVNELAEGLAVEGGSVHNFLVELAVDRSYTHFPPVTP